MAHGAMERVTHEVVGGDAEHFPALTPAGLSTVRR